MKVSAPKSLSAQIRAVKPVGEDAKNTLCTDVTLRIPHHDATALWFMKHLGRAIGISGRISLTPTSKAPLFADQEEIQEDGTVGYGLSKKKTTKKKATGKKKTTKKKATSKKKKTTKKASGTKKKKTGAKTSSKSNVIPGPGSKK